MLWLYYNHIEHHGRVHLSSDMTKYDDERLRFLVEKHYEFTNSEKAFTYFIDKTFNMINN